jgi:hypothetical protein
MAFIAFDSVEQKFVLQTLKTQCVQDKYITVIRNIYNHGYAKTKIDSEEKKFRLEREVKQGDPTSLELFTCLLEHIFRKLNWSNRCSLNINGRKLTNLRFADDVILFSNSNGKLQEMVNDLTKLSKDAGL